jgi:hypothetical protein
MSRENYRFWLLMAFGLLSVYAYTLLVAKVGL